MKVLKRTSHWIRKVGMLVILGILGIGLGWAQDHDLVISPAPDLTSANPTNWKSPDIKIGADFGSSSVPDLVQRGVPNDIYVRFRVNGMQDHTVVSGSIQVKFYYRPAIPFLAAPPALTDPTWTPIGQLWVTYIPSDGPFAITRVWPTDFPSVVAKSVSWTPLASGDYYHIAAELVYPVGTIDANSADNVAISLYESKSGLLDVVLLHDVSGSMGYYYYNGYKYIDLAKSKASVFLASMTETHRFSVVAFSDDYTGGYSEVWPTALPWLRPASTPNKNNALAAVAGMTAQGMTPLGQGLERAIEILTTPLEPDRKRVIILLSDGEENWGTPRACPGAALDPCVGSALMPQLLANSIKVFTIALGTSAGPQCLECLECLANQTGGQWYSSPDASIELTDVLLAVQQAASADDLYRVDKGVSGGGDDTYSTYFEGKDNALYFILSWDELETNLELKLNPPGGRQPRMATEVFKGKGYHVIKVINPSRGTWTYSVTGADGKNYLAAVRSDRVGVTLRMETFSEGIVGTPIKIKARLTDAGRPLTNARAIATVQVPVRHSLATILQTAYRDHLKETGVFPVDPRDQVAKPDISPQTAFIGKLMGNRQEPLVKTEMVKVTLKHVGNGFYEGVLKEEYTTIAGEYNVAVTCADERFHRNFSKPLRIQPGEIDFERSYAQVMKVRMPRVQEPTWLLQVYAVDRFGNAVTVPSLRERVRSEVKGARVVKPQILFGTFQQQLNVVEGERPEVRGVSLDGRKIRVEER